MKTVIAPVFVSAMVFFAVIISALPAKADASWNVQNVDNKAALYGGLCLALDSNGVPHVAYVDSENGFYFVPNTHYQESPQYLTYARLTSSGWNITAVDKWVRPVPEIGGDCEIGNKGLALGTNDSPHMVYDTSSVKGVQYSLNYATLREGNWTIQKVDFGKGGTLSVDAAGNPHIAYAGERGILKYATLTGSNWTIQTVDARSNRFLQDMNTVQYIALDSNDQPNIVYNVNSTFKLARKNALGWSVQTVFSNPNASKLGNLVIDSKDYPRFTYTDSANYSLIYEYWNGLTWRNQGITNLDPFSGESMISLDSNDNPHVSYTSAPNERHVMYASLIESEWVIQTVDTGNLITAYAVPSALDSRDNLHLCYLKIRETFSRYFVDGTVIHASNIQHVQTPTLLPSESPQSSPNNSLSPTMEPESFPMMWVEASLAVAVLVIGGLAAYFLWKKPKHAS